ncbi:MAG TPA: lasso peptide biosynthesis B2 protein [Solirubrobacteraceae bacterium]|nr:lasso peptide biosynthesis B2 protein [Solirubrobacteraceae bacterium]
MAAPSPDPRGVAACLSHAAAETTNIGGRLSHAERLRLAVEILSAYARARRALRRAPIGDAVADLRSRSQSAPRFAGSTPATLDEARRLGRAVTRLLALLPGDTRCLARSLVLTRLLARRGIPAKLVIGARAGPEFLAHAWVEHAGDPVLVPGDESFGRLVEL